MSEGPNWRTRTDISFSSLTTIVFIDISICVSHTSMVFHCLHCLPFDSIDQNIRPSTQLESRCPSHEMNDLTKSPTTATKNMHTTNFSLSDSTWKQLIKTVSSPSPQRFGFC